MSNPLNVVKIEDLEQENKAIFEKIKDRRFFAVSIDESFNVSCHHCMMSNYEIVYLCNLMINKVMNGELDD